MLPVEPDHTGQSPSSRYSYPRLWGRGRNFRFCRPAPATDPTHFSGQVNVLGAPAGRALDSVGLHDRQDIGPAHLEVRRAPSIVRRKIRPLHSGTLQTLADLRSQPQPRTLETAVRVPGKRAGNPELRESAQRAYSPTTAEFRRPRSGSVSTRADSSRQILISAVARWRH